MRKSVPLVISQLLVQEAFRERGKRETPCTGATTPPSEFHCYPVKHPMLPGQGMSKRGGFMDTEIKVHYVNKTLQEQLNYIKKHALL